MRDAFHENLDRISDDLVEMTRLAGSALARATSAIMDADVSLAESVIAADQRLDDMRVKLDDLGIDLLARQQPVATDLRMVVTGMRMASDLERMGDLAKHIAKIARLRYPDCAVPEQMRPLFSEMAEAAQHIVTETGQVISSKNAHGVAELTRADDRMDELHKASFDTLADETWPHPGSVTADMTLLARYYERFADHAVLVAHQVAFLVTGEWHSQAERVETDALTERHEAPPA